MEKRLGHDRTLYGNSSVRLIKPPAKNYNFYPKLKNKSTFVSLLKTKSTSKRINNRTMGEKADPRDYFKVVEPYQKTGFEDFLMNELFRVKYMPSENSIPQTPKNEESLEIIKMGTTIHYSKALLSYISSTRKSIEPLSQHTFIKPLDLSNLNFSDNRILNFKSQVQSLVQELNRLELGGAHVTAIKDHLNRVCEITDIVMREKAVPRIAMTFSSHLKENIRTYEGRN